MAATGSDGTAHVIDGKEVAARIRREVAQEVELLRRPSGAVPGLAVILVGENPASVVYVRNKRRACEEVGIRSTVHHLGQETTRAQLLDLIEQLNNDPQVHGVLLQLPLPEPLDGSEFLSYIDPSKDVDGFHPLNMGRLLEGRPTLVPCTPAGIMELIDSTKVDLTGKRAVVIGRSNIVGKPVAILLLARHATVTICHSRTKDLPLVAREADVLVAATGRARMVGGDWIKPGAVVIDVGINRLPDGTLSGDVDFDAARHRAAFITPVPGGVGPMTVAMLMRNTVLAMRRQMGLKSEA